MIAEKNAGGEYFSLLKRHFLPLFLMDLGNLTENKKILLLAQYLH
ncbi:hypothetical protein MEZE111188_18620 [Mesobacillus zeae]